MPSPCIADQDFDLDERATAVFGPWLDAAPLIAYVEATGIPIIQLLGEQGRRAYHRAKREGRIRTRGADRLATTLGLHATEIWGHDFYADVA